MFFFGLRFPLQTQTNIARLVGLLHRALRMNAATRIRSFPAYRTQGLNTLRLQRKRFAEAHVAPIAKKEDRRSIAIYARNSLL
jgi:hypothetical protein